MEVVQISSQQQIVRTGGPFDVAIATKVCQAAHDLTGMSAAPIIFS
jgi:hypothetical protein